jgi:hypothetical protein
VLELNNVCVQGADGDNFYVVESGLFGVLVDTGNWVSELTN